MTFSWLKSVSTIQHLFFSKRTSHLWIWSVHPHNPPPHHHYLHLDFFFTATLAVVPKARLGFRLVFTAKPHLPPEVHTRKPAEALEAGGSNYRLPDPVAAVRFMDFWTAKFVFRHSAKSFLENEGENVLSSNFWNLLCFGSHAFAGSTLIREGIEPVFFPNVVHVCKEREPPQHNPRVA